MEQKNLNKDEIMEIVKDFNINPIFNKVIISLNRDEIEGFEIDEVGLSDTQYVIAGTIEYKDQIIKPGDKIMIDLKGMQKPIKSENLNSYETVYQIEIDPVYYNGYMFGIINDRLVKALIK